jgi:hypothetical protein
MSLTTKISRNTVTVTADNSTAIDLAAILGCAGIPIPIQGISHYPNALGDTIIVRDGGATEAIIWKDKNSGIATDYMGNYIMFPGGKRCLPYIVGNEIANGAIVTFHLF